MQTQAEKLEKIRRGLQCDKDKSAQHLGKTWDPRSFHYHDRPHESIRSRQLNLHDAVVGEISTL